MLDRAFALVRGLVLVGFVAMAVLLVVEAGGLPGDGGPLLGLDDTDDRRPVVPEEPMTPVPAAETGPAVTPEPTPTERRAADNPWGRERIVLAVEDRSGTNRSFVRAVRAAADYWERHPGLAEYPFEFVLRPDAADPDVVVRYAPTVDCGGHGEAKGCAPVLSAGSDPPDPVVVRIAAGQEGNFRTDRNAVIHELGHVLGRTHCEEPTWAMGPGCADTPARSDVTERGVAWRDGTLRVHLDYGSVDDRTAARQQVRLALAAYATGGNGTVPANLTFRRVEDPYLADISVRVGAEGGCRADQQVCAEFVGTDVDGDGAAEFYSRATVTLEPAPAGRLGWYLGRWLGEVITPDGIPERFETPSRDGPWWEGIPERTRANATGAETGRTVP